MNKLSLSCLIIDDDSGDIEIVRRSLANVSRFVITVIPCQSLESIATMPSDTVIDIILLDYQLGAITGLEALCLLREQGYHQPVIMLTGQGNEQVAVEAMKAGATDYLIKDDLTWQVLERSIANALAKVELEAKVDAQQQQILKQATTDSLTGLNNRGFCLQRLEKAWHRAGRYNKPLSLVMMDLDHFKHINDTYGHPAGDKVLARTGALIASVLRETDIAGRYGGEEFVLALDNTDLDGAIILAERVRQIMAQELFQVEESLVVPVTCSIGVSCLDPDLGIIDIETLLRAADEALYLAKNWGRNQVAVNPRHEKLGSGRKERPHSPMARSRKGRVLIVEDNLATLRLLQSMLTPIVEVVYEATSGVEALAILNREEVDLLITDLKMPEMDGLELMRRTRSLLPELPAIVVTADESRQAVLTALRLGAINYLTKPIQVEELAIAVHQGMERVEMLARIRRRETLWGKTKELLVWLMKSFANPVFIVDDNGICLFSNEAAARFFGIPSGPPANWRFGRLSKSHGEEDIGLLSPCQRPCLATMRMSRAAWENSEVTFVLVDNMCEAAEGVSILE